MKVLTAEEHRKYNHLCGLTGEQVDAEKPKCRDCPKLHDCLNDHAIVGVDAESRLKLEGMLRDQNRMYV